MSSRTGTTCPICGFLPGGESEFCDECGWLLEQEPVAGTVSEETDLQQILGFRPFIILPDRGAFGLNRRKTIIGREFGDILLREDLNVSRIHVSLSAEGNNLYVEDLGSSNGTLLNGTRIQPQKQYPLSDGDQIEIGDTKLKIEFKGLPAEDDERKGTFLLGPTGEKIRLKRGENTIGRLPVNTIQIDHDPYLAREHASIFIEESPSGDDFVYILDRGSSNGTLLNGKMIAPDARIRIKSDDTIKLGAHEYSINQGK